jgi:hypothetical protein
VAVWLSTRAAGNVAAPRGRAPASERQCNTQKLGDSDAIPLFATTAALDHAEPQFPAPSAAAGGDVRPWLEGVRPADVSSSTGDDLA